MAVSGAGAGSNGGARLAEVCAVLSLATGTVPWPIEVLYLASANALTGPRVLVDVAVDDIVSSIDWTERAQAG